MLEGLNLYAVLSFLVQYIVYLQIKKNVVYVII